MGVCGGGGGLRWLLSPEATSVRLRLHPPSLCFPSRSCPDVCVVCRYDGSQMYAEEVPDEPTSTTTAAADADSVPPSASVAGSAAPVDTAAVPSTTATAPPVSVSASASATATATSTLPDSSPFGVFDARFKFDSTTGAAPTRYPTLPMPKVTAVETGTSVASVTSTTGVVTTAAASHDLAALSFATIPTESATPAMAGTLPPVVPPPSHQATANKVVFPGRLTAANSRAVACVERQANEVTLHYNRLGSDAFSESVKVRCVDAPCSRAVCVSLSRPCSAESAWVALFLRFLQVSAKDPISTPYVRTNRVPCVLFA